MTSRENRRRGFTLIEMTVGLLITAVLTLGLFRIFKTTSASFNRGTENIDGQQNARAALNWIARELRGAKGFTLVNGDEVTFLWDQNVANQARTFRLDDGDQDGDGDVTELLLVRNPDDDGTPGVFTDEIAVGIDSLAFVYRDGAGNVTSARATVQEVEVMVFARGHRLGREAGDARHDSHETGMTTRVRCRNLGKTIPTGGDVVPPDAPLGLAVTMGCGTATLTWSANSETDLAGYYLAYDTSGGAPYGGTDANQGPSPIFVGSTTSYTLTGLDLSTTYYFNLRAVDAADNIGPWGTEVNGIPSDSFPPQAPTNLLGRVVENDEIYLGWTASSDWDVAFYRVDWTGDDDPTTVHSEETPNAYLRLTGLDADVTYTCIVTAVDACGNESSPTAPITVTLVPCDDDITFPEIPEEVSASAGDGFVRLTWIRVPDTDVVGYQVYFEDESSHESTLLVGNVNTFTIHGLVNGEQYQLQVAALDGCGHVGGFSGLIDATPIHCGAGDAPPAAPNNLVATDLGLGDRVTLSWTRSTEGDVLGYMVHWGTNSGSYDYSDDVGVDIFHTVTGLVAGTETFFAVSAYDVCGNEGDNSSEARATPTWGCVCPPTASTVTPGNYAVVAGTVAWTVTATACSTSSVQRVEFHVDGTVRHVDYSAPYEFGDFGLGWETAFESDGPHTLVAATSDDNGCIASDTTQVYVDNASAGLSCLGIEDGVSAQLEGAYNEGLSVVVSNFSAVETYKLDAIVLDWSGSGFAPTSVSFDALPAWAVTSFPGAPGDTLWLSTELDVPPGGTVTMGVDFWDYPPSAVPNVPLTTAGVEVTFLGAPIASCGPYPVSVVAPLCDPGVTIVSVTSSNPYDVFGVPSVGDQYYTDRSYTLTQLPDELNGAVLVRTPNADKNAGGSHALTLDFTEAATVYIGYDPRGTPPNWIKNFYTNTGLTIGVTDSGTSTLGLWRRNLGAGNQVFKGNKASGWGGSVGTNYVIFVRCQEIGI